MSGSDSPLNLGRLPDFFKAPGDAHGQSPADSPEDGLDSLQTEAMARSFASIALQHIRALNAWQKFNVQGEGAVVAVIDSGCNRMHPNLAPRVLPGKAFIPGQSDSDTQDRFGHGTGVAGLIAASGGQGIAPRARILPLKIYQNKDDRENVMVRLAEALEHIIDRDNVSVVNISLGNGSNHEGEQNLPAELVEVGARISNAVVTLRQKHIPVVAASGNDFATFRSSVGMCFPAILPNIISVGAVHSNDAVRNFTYPYGDAKTLQSRLDAIAPFSQRLPRSTGAAYTRLIAPGAPIAIIAPTGGFVGESGTSLAAPLVSGVIALIQALHIRRFGQRPTCSEIEDWLIAGAQKIEDKLGDHVNVHNTGATFHRVDALGALDQIPNPSGPSS